MSFLQKTRYLCIRIKRHRWFSANNNCVVAGACRGSARKKRYGLATGLWCIYLICLCHYVAKKIKKIKSREKETPSAQSCRDPFWKHSSENLQVITEALRGRTSCYELRTTKFVRTSYALRTNFTMNFMSRELRTHFVQNWSTA